MKTILFCVWILPMAFFIQQPENAPARQVNQNTGNKRTRPIHDTIIVYASGRDTFAYSKKEFEAIVNFYPSLTSPYVMPPDVSFTNAGFNKLLKDPKNELTELSFGSEAGQDQYYVLYAYFLRKKNLDPRSTRARDVLFNIFQQLNRMGSILVNGGTGFGHLSIRIIGYSEYATYQYKAYPDTDGLSKAELKLKKLFMETLKQQAEVKMSHDNDPQENEVKRKKLAGCLTELDALITNDFYLETAMAFWFNHYRY